MEDVLGPDLPPSATMGGEPQPLRRDRRCPHNGEAWASGQFRRTRYDHRVHTATEVDIQGARPVLVVRATCQCGWSETTVLGGED